MQIGEYAVIVIQSVLNVIMIPNIAPLQITMRAGASSISVTLVINTAARADSVIISKRGKSKGLQIEANSHDGLFLNAVID